MKTRLMRCRENRQKQMLMNRQTNADKLTQNEGNTHLPFHSFVHSLLLPLPCCLLLRCEEETSCCVKFDMSFDRLKYLMRPLIQKKHFYGVLFRLTICIFQLCVTTSATDAPVQLVVKLHRCNYSQQTVNTAARAPLRHKVAATARSLYLWPYDFHNHRIVDGFAERAIKN